MSYHTRSFRRLAETVGFLIPRSHWRYGWAETRPGPRLVETFRDLSLDEAVLAPLAPFQDQLTPVRNGIRCHCGLPRLPDRQEIQGWLEAREPAARYRPESTVRSLKVQRVRQGERYVPMLRQKGQWLSLFGFRESCQAIIEARFGRLVIETRDTPQRDTPQSPSAGLRTAPAPKFKTCV